MGDDQQGSATGTVASDYGSCYYNDAHLGGYDNYSWDNEQWRGFFQLVADRIVAIAGRGRMLDVGCAKGLLVQALREKGADARGFDISQHAVEAAHADVREHLWVASATDPIEGRYDLVSMIEMIEHMGPQDAQAAIDRVTAVTDRVLFSSSPADHDEPTHVNTKPTASWAAWFAERGFHRRTDVDLSFLSPWAVLFERADRSVRDVVQAYETHLTSLNAEVLEKRSALLAAHRNISELRDGSDGSKALAEQVALVKQFEAEVMEARHTQLLNRDHVVGIEAEIGRQNDQILELTSMLRRLSGREKRLTARKTAQARRIKGLQDKLETARQRNAALTRRVRELEADAAPSSLTRRVVRRLRGSGR
jgi:SAM-dependent methyltransferase